MRKQLTLNRQAFSGPRSWCHALLTLLALAVVIPLKSQADPGTAQAAFTYQGRLLDNGQPANGTYDLQFRLADAPAEGNYIGPSLTNAALEVKDGLFLVTLDFGATIFDGSSRWLEIGVRTSGSSDPCTWLAPRQPITATPYAAFANRAAVADVATNL